jgi:hypothetical protein
MAENSLAQMRGEAFLNFLQQSMQQKRDFHLGPWAIASGTYICVALRTTSALGRGQAGNDQRAVASRA